MLLPITLTLAAAAALFNIWLAWRVGRVRTAQKILHGDGGCAPLIRRMRAQANFVEYTPFVLILVGLIEMAMGSSTWLWLIALLYMGARIAHAFGMDSNSLHKGRMIGIIVTMLTLATLSGIALYAAYSGLDEMEAPAGISAHV